MWWREYVGIPFKEKGRDMQGSDCWGLVRLVYQKHRGIDLPSYDDLYADTHDKDACCAIIDNESAMRWEPVTKAEPFDVLIMRLRGVPMHVALVTTPGYMLHCSHGIDAVIERYDSIKWRSSVTGIVRYAGQSSSLFGTSALQQQANTP